ncbi:MAG: glycosyltransferase family 2 protein [Peptococcaceae bacterium]|jgi:dolichol-phosphate mannosyltransferase|nr:glycosyltransferase family 2 protein [Peptococcaceae bacterium]
MIKYSIVVPMYNEELVAEVCHRRLTEALSGLEESYELIYVNDGSRDRTEAILEGLREGDAHVRLIHFSRNFGHQAAVSAGMRYSSGQAVVVIDADLQDPPEVIPEMIAKWKAGYDVVYGKRTRRMGESFFKKITAKLFYRILASMTNVEIPVDAGDFRLLDRKVCDVMNGLTEKNPYLRGLVSWVGFKQTYVEFIREERFAGETKYPLKKMIKFAIDGITAFSMGPLKMAANLGFCMSGLSFLYLIWALVQRTVGQVVAGWASMVALMLFFDGVILILLGVMGEYVGRIYDECKNRPLFIVAETKGFGEHAASARPGENIEDE